MKTSLRKAWDQFKGYRIQYENDTEALGELRRDIEKAGIVTGLLHFEAWISARQANGWTQEKEIGYVDASTLAIMSEGAKYNMFREHFSKLPILGVMLQFPPNFKPPTPRGAMANIQKRSEMSKVASQRALSLEERYRDRDN